MTPKFITVFVKHFNQINDPNEAFEICIATDRIVSVEPVNDESACVIKLESGNFLRTETATYQHILNVLEAHDG